MIGHLLKIMWNKKANNSLMILEVFLSFLILFSVISYVIYNYDRFTLPLGFETENKWMIHLDRYEDQDSLYVAQTQTNLFNELSQLNHVKSVAFSNAVSPYSNSTWQSTDDSEGFPISSRYAYVDENYGDAMGFNLLDGRWFTEDDINSTYKPVIVSKRFVDMYFPDKNMVDSIFSYGGECKIVGIIDDYRYNGRFEEEVNTILRYSPYTEDNMITVYLSLEKNTPQNFEEEVHTLVQNITKSTSFVIEDLSLKRSRSERGNWFPIISLIVISGFLCINVSLGLFGVLTYTISKRRGEIGLRRALGASPGNIASQFTTEILILAGMAIIAGIFFAIQVPLLDLIPIDSSIFYRSIVFSTVIILAIVILCALYPSRQASRIHPATALHED